LLKKRKRLEITKLLMEVSQPLKNSQALKDKKPQDSRIFFDLDRFHHQTAFSTDLALAVAFLCEPASQGLKGQSSYFPLFQKSCNPGWNYFGLENLIKKLLEYHDMYIFEEKKGS
jgi:hypothetical protein